MKTSTESTKNSYGLFSLVDSLICELSGFNIQIKTLGDKKYSYLRTSNGVINISKIFTSKASKIKIEIAPILPQNLPDKITEYIMLKFNEILQIEKQSNTKFDVLHPIEIGVFVVSDEENRSLIECFSLDPLLSRYGMYGSPDDGILCKCFRTALDGKKQQTQFSNSKISITFQNDTNSDILISKIAFLSTNHDIFYNSTDTVTDGIICIVKETLGNVFAQINSQNIESSSEFTKSPTITQKTSEQFTMDKGFM